ncbi:hypothetical protein LQ318_08455 [Aliifodinibius salicampi]|uniref:Antitoxin VbhA domain-containing protein n=1 Tax=Fodinibius salicampi TaxID=1920655 RepID=A0ABT3PYJ9_9BACT|nr:hypothetical protein [Fodinibius salicampi]MCW9712934.1 hypothetical protein [Fodinibius salicampi]
MKTVIPISIKRQAVEHLSAVRQGQMSRREAEQTLKAHLRYSSKLREDLVEALSRDYDQEAVEAMKYFRLI